VFGNHATLERKLRQHGKAAFAMQNLTPDPLLPATSAESGPDPRREARRATPLAGSRRRYGTCGRRRTGC
jgi:hypothetical protein